MKKLWRAWDRFWFAPVDTFKISLMRLGLGLLMLWLYGNRAFNVTEFYTDQGMVLASQAPELMHDFYRPLFFFGATPWTVPLHALFLLLIGLLILGIGGRLTSFLALMPHLTFIQRNFSIVYGVELVVSCWLFYLSLVRNNEYFSLKNYKWSEEPRYNTEHASSVGYRLLQLQMCAIYGYTGLEKLKGTPWWTGSALWSVLGNQQYMMVDLSFLQNVPSLIAIASFASVMFEVYFPVLVWIRPARKWLLLFGLLFHGLIGLGMGLVSFGIAMVLGYLPFLDDRTLRSVLKRTLTPHPRS